MKTKEIECILRLVNSDMYLDLKEYIVENKLAAESDFKGLTRDFEKATFICGVLDVAAKENKLILLDYEWVILPKEYIKITCVTETEKKEFTHGI